MNKCGKYLFFSSIVNVKLDKKAPSAFHNSIPLPQFIAFIKMNEEHKTAVTRLIDAFFLKNKFSNWLLKKRPSCEAWAGIIVFLTSKTFLPISITSTISFQSIIYVYRLNFFLSILIFYNIRFFRISTFNPNLT